MNFVRYPVIASVITAILLFFHCVQNTSDPGETTLPVLPDLHTEGLDTDPTGSPSGVDTSAVSFSIVLSGDDTVYPATEVSIVSRVSDDISGDRPDLAATTRWRVLEFGGQSEEALKERIGQTVTFIPEVAYSTVVIEGSVFDGGDTLRDTVRLYIAPWKAYRIHVDVSPDDTVCPYTAVSLLCSVSDDSFGERPDLAGKTAWRIIDLNGQSENTLKKSVGQFVTFVPNIAYSRVSIEGAVPDGRNTLRDTVHLYIKPGEAYKIYIEPYPVDSASDTLVLRYPQELNHISMLDNSVHCEAYAVARDSSGAFVRLADSISTQWSISEAGISLVQAMGETGRKYHGVVTRISDEEGQTYLIAEEPGLPGDSAIVSIASYYIVRIQLRDTTGSVVDTIRMYSDETRTYEVWGLKSTMVDQPDYPESWVRITVIWNFSNEPYWSTSPPSLAHSWVADPTTTGEGTLTLTNPGDQRSELLVLPVIVTVRSLTDTAVSIQIITAPPRQAGDTIMAQVKIFNSDGFIPGTYCFGTGSDDPHQAVYSDALGTGGSDRPFPVLMVNGVDTVLNVQNASQFGVDQCFENGIDTIRFILYYAPFITDSLHQISVILGPNLTAHTQPFILLPSSLDSIGIENVNFNTVPPVALTGSESATLYSDGYDTWGNRIGFITASWTATGTLGALQEESRNVYITADGITYDQAGTICASAFRVDGSIIQSCLPVNITAPNK